MDFVVVGLGLGGLGILLGLLTRDVGSRRWRLRPDVEAATGEASRRVAAARACRAGGRVLALGGGGVCLATLAALLLRLSDRAGALLVLLALLATAAGSILWAATYAHRYHPRPVGARPARRVAPVAPHAGATVHGDDLVDAPVATPVPVEADPVSAQTAAAAAVPAAAADGGPDPGTSASAPTSPDDDRSPASDAGNATRVAADPAVVPVADVHDVGEDGGGDRAQTADDRSSPSSSRPLTPASTPS